MVRDCLQDLLAPSCPNAIGRRADARWLRPARVMSLTPSGNRIAGHRSRLQLVRKPFQTVAILCSSFPASNPRLQATVAKAFEQFVAEVLFVPRQVGPRGSPRRQRRGARSEEVDLMKSRRLGMRLDCGMLIPSCSYANRSFTTCRAGRSIGGRCRCGGW